MSVVRFDILFRLCRDSVFIYSIFSIGALIMTQWLHCVYIFSCSDIFQTKVHICCQIQNTSIKALTSIFWVQVCIAYSPFHCILHLSISTKNLIFSQLTPHRDVSIFKRFPLLDRKSGGTSGSWCGSARCYPGSRPPPTAPSVISSRSCTVPNHTITDPCQKLGWKLCFARPKQIHAKYINLVWPSSLRMIYLFHAKKLKQSVCAVSYGKGPSFFVEHLPPINLTGNNIVDSVDNLIVNSSQYVFYNHHKGFGVLFIPTRRHKQGPVNRSGNQRGACPHGRLSPAPQLAALRPPEPGCFQCEIMSSGVKPETIC